MKVNTLYNNGLEAFELKKVLHKCERLLQSILSMSGEVFEVLSTRTQLLGPTLKAKT